MARLLCGSSLVLLLCVLAFASANLVQFAEMIKKVTGRDALLYNTYGCYCGLGGSKQPLDETDWCCRLHDCCYHSLEPCNCQPKLATYSYSGEKDNITCGGKTECQRLTCECDKEVTLCFSRSKFQVQNIGYPNLLCNGASPPCPDVRPYCI